MNERKIIVTGLVGIGILVVVALVGIRLLGGGGPATPATGTGALAPPAIERAPAPTPPPPQPALAPTAPDADPRRAGALPREVAPAVARPPGEEPRAWPDVETTLRPDALGPSLAEPVSNGLADARQRMQPCFAQERRRLEGGDPGAAPGGGQAPAVLVLRLEAREGKLVVADTEVVSEGTSSRSLVDCCRAVLRSYEIVAPGAAAPERFRVMLPLL